jgi:hypothetical protein
MKNFKKSLIFISLFSIPVIPSVSHAANWLDLQFSSGLGGGSSSRFSLMNINVEDEQEEQQGSKKLSDKKIKENVRNDVEGKLEKSYILIKLINLTKDDEKILNKLDKDTKFIYNGQRYVTILPGENGHKILAIYFNRKNIFLNLFKCNEIKNKLNRPGLMELSFSEERYLLDCIKKYYGELKQKKEK